MRGRITLENETKLVYIFIFHPEEQAGDERADQVCSVRGCLMRRPLTLVNVDGFGSSHWGLPIKSDCHILCHLYFSISSSQRIKINSNRPFWGWTLLLGIFFAMKVQTQCKSESVVALCCSVRLAKNVHSQKLASKTFSYAISSFFQTWCFENQTQLFFVLRLWFSVDELETLNSFRFQFELYGLNLLSSVSCHDQCCFPLNSVGSSEGWLWLRDDLGQNLDKKRITKRIRTRAHSFISFQLSGISPHDQRLSCQERSIPTR